MATVIDALVVTLGLDPKAFKTGIKQVDDGLNQTGKVAAKTGKGIEDAGKKGAEAMGRLRNEVLRTVAVFVGLAAIKSFVSGVTNSDAAVGRMARTLDMSIGQLSAWKQVAEQAGVSGDSVAGDMDGLSQSLQRFSITGEGGEAFKYFRALGIILTDLKTGAARDQFDVLLEVADKFKGMDPAKAKAMGAGMGFGADTVALALKGRAALLKARADAAQNGLSPEDEKNANARNEAWTKLGNTFARIARDVLNIVTPAMVGFLNFVQEHAGSAAAMLTSVAAAMTAMSLVRFGGMLGSLAQLGIGISGVAGKAGLLASILGRIGLVGAAGAGAFGITRFLMESTGLDAGMGWLGGKIFDGTHKNPSMAGGYVPGTVRGLGDVSAKQARLRELEQQMGLPAGLLDSVWKQESGRGKNLHSGAGASGDFQFMPGTAAQYGVDTNSFESSASGAARMYADLLRQYHGNLPMALAGYNWGSGNLQRQGLGAAPMETQNYIRSITANMRGNGATASNSTSEVHVGQINVHTQATDADGVARDIHTAMANHAQATQANVGLS